jgi:putative ATPase
MAIDTALSDIRNGEATTVPRNLQNKHFDGDDAAVKGQHYLYPHDYPDHWVKQQYLPDNLVGRKYYVFGDNKTEQTAKCGNAVTPPVACALVRANLPELCGMR